jgi:hypothetical protein
MSRRALLCLLVAIVAVGGLVPAHTEFDRLQQAADSMDSGGQHGWGKLKLDLSRILGTCMDYGVPQAVFSPIRVEHEAIRDVSDVAPPPTLDRTEPRPPSA